MQLPRPTRAEREDAAWLAQRGGTGRTDAAAGAQSPAAASGGGNNDLRVADDASGHDRRGGR